MLTIGILQADDVLPQFVGIHGNYPEMFERILGDRVRDVSFRHYNVQVGEYPASTDECDGYVITGSKLSVYDDEDWIRQLEDFVRELHERKQKLVGICFGHQLVAQALGGKTEPADVGWGCGNHFYDLIDEAPFMDDVASFGLLVSHKDQVTELPEGARLLAGNDHCPNASFVIDDHILTFQGHPEFKPEYSRDLMNFRREILGETKYENGMASLERGNDSGRVAEWILRFVEGAERR